MIVEGPACIVGSTTQVEGGTQSRYEGQLMFASEAVAVERYVVGSQSDEDAV